MRSRKWLQPFRRQIKHPYIPPIGERNIDIAVGVPNWDFQSTLLWQFRDTISCIPELQWFLRAEVELDFDGGVFDAIGSVNGVLADIDGEVLPNGADSGFLRVGGTD